MPTTSWELHFLWLFKPFGRCLGFYSDCTQHDSGQLICMDHLVSITWKQCRRARDRGWPGMGVLASNHPADVKALIDCSACWIVGQGGRVSPWQFFFPYSLKEIFVLNSLTSWLIYFFFFFQNAVLEFWMSLVVCTQITAKRLSLLVTRKPRPDLLLNGLGKAQNMRER